MTFPALSQETPRLLRARLRLANHFPCAECARLTRESGGRLKAFCPSGFRAYAEFLSAVDEKERRAAA